MGSSIVEPYNEDVARKQARQRSSKKHSKKWVPKLRYVRDRYNMPAIHSGENRHDRRAYAAYLRRWHTDFETGLKVPGSRSKAKAKARATGRPVAHGR